MSGSNQAVFMNQRSFGPPPGQEAFTTAGTFTWVAPAGVTKVSVVAVGGGSMSGGGLGYKNNYTVTPGTSYTVVVGAGTAGSQSGSSIFVNASTLRGGGASAYTRGTYTGDGGGCGGGSSGGGGGGAGGYSGAGGNGAYSLNGSAGAGGGGGGGAGYYESFCSGCCTFCFNYGGGGGGVGILGQGSNGAGGVLSGSTANGGGGGSGGNAGVTMTDFCNFPTAGGGSYGGGASCKYASFSGIYSVGQGAGGAVRIIWPGCARSFPSTRTANE